MLFLEVVMYCMSICDSGFVDCTVYVVWVLRGVLSGFVILFDFLVCYGWVYWSRLGGCCFDVMPVFVCFVL